MAEPIIEARGLTKHFTVGRRTVEAVSDLSFAVAPGELVAFLGPNGAGKSTSLRMLTTLIEPTAGDARVAGHDIRREAAGVRARIGYVGQLTSGSYAQRARDELLAQGAFHGMSPAASRRRADDLIDSLDLAPFASRTVQKLSGGQKRRLDVALGLMHAPPLLFLDEPSTGLDPQSRANLWQHILDLRSEHGTTIFLTTHYLEEADRWAERVMVMDRGRVVADDTAARLKSELAGDTLTIELPSAAEADRAAGVLARLVGGGGPTGEAVRRTGEASITVTRPDGSRLLPQALRTLDEAGLHAVSATGVPPTLDDVFLALTGRTLRESDHGDGAGGESGTSESGTSGSDPSEPSAATDPATEGAYR